MNHTQNYQLNQWEADDRVQRVDFNADNAKLDAALGAKCEIVTGSYTGDGAESRTIPLGFTPKAVLVFQQNGATYFSYSLVQMFGGLILPGKPVTYHGLEAAKVVDGGFWVAHIIPRGSSGGDPTAQTNTDGMEYYYIAFR